MKQVDTVAFVYPPRVGAPVLSGMLAAFPLAVLMWAAIALAVLQIT